MANNVYAHVPDINDFTLGIKNLLADNGVVTIEFPHLLNLLQKKQFDTIYHEHFSYFSLNTLIFLMSKYKLKLIDVDTNSKKGGSIRVIFSKNQRINIRY